MRFLSFRRTAICFLFLSIAALSVADLKVIAEIKTSMNGDFHPTQVTTTYYHGDWVRVDAAHKTTITNTKTRKAIVIDHATKTYSTAGANAMLDVLQGMKPTISVSVTPTEEQKLILDHQTTKYHCTIDLGMTPPMAAGGAHEVHVKGTMDSWVAQDLSATGAGDGWRAAQVLFFGILDMKGLDSALTEFGKIKGYPLENHLTMSVDSPDMPAGGPAIEMDLDVLAISQANLNPALFQIPSDYKAQDAQGWSPAKT
jgi:hypothetical protein